jgi:outer membrane protein assembly factor BamD (BamD/ComL family)
MRKLSSLLILMGLMLACSSADDQQAKQAKLKELEAQMRSLETLDTSLASQMVVGYRDYVAAYPKDSLSPFYQKKIAELYRAWPGKDEEVVEAYNKLMADYTYHEEGIRAVLSLALYYEERGDKQQALAAYQHFIDNFPSHSLADQARQLQDLLANEKVSDIQMVEEWMRKAKDSSQKESNSAN